jgi:broad specificity phosphatase PhoE
MPALLLVRHAQASFGGADYDVISDLGHVQIGTVADWLAVRGGRIERVLSGTLRRQRDTAQVIAKVAGVSVSVDPGWDEYHADDILGHHVPDDLDLRRGASAPRAFQATLESALRAWIAAGADSVAAESWDAFSGRVQAALHAATSGLASGTTAVAVTSGGPIAAIAAALLGAPPGSLVELNRVAINTGITKITVGRGGMTLVSFNEHSHLGDGELVTYR